MKCEHQDWLDTDEGLLPTGPACDADATHLSCTPIMGAPVCAKHQCRCHKLIPLVGAEALSAGVIDPSCYKAEIPREGSIFSKPNPRNEWAKFAGLSSTKPSRAVVFQGEWRLGTVLWYVGADISFECDENGFHCLEDLGLDTDKLGIRIWEGHYRFHSEYSYGDSYHYDGCGDMEPDGKFRDPTPEEWLLIQQGKPPWDPKDWEL